MLALGDLGRPHLGLSGRRDPVGVTALRKPRTAIERTGG